MSKVTKEDVFQFLDALRRLGQTNMFGATPYIMLAYPKLNEEQAKYLLKEWMKTFSERHEISEEE